MNSLALSYYTINQQKDIYSISDEIKLIIFNNLEYKDLLILRLVSRKINALIKDISLENKFTLLQRVVLNPPRGVTLRSSRELTMSYLSISLEERQKGVLHFIKEGGLLRSFDNDAIEADTKRLEQRGCYLSPLYLFPYGWNRNDKKASDIFKRLIEGQSCGHFDFAKKRETFPTKNCFICLADV